MSLKRKCEITSRKPNSVERESVTGIKEAGHTEIQPLLCHVAEDAAVMTG
jgi:hypothetical protein